MLVGLLRHGEDAGPTFRSDKDLNVRGLLLDVGLPALFPTKAGATGCRMTKPPLRMRKRVSRAKRKQSIRPMPTRATFSKSRSGTGRNSYSVVDMLYAGNRLEKARAIFDEAVTRRPRGRYLIRQGIRVLRKWPADNPTG